MIQEVLNELGAWCINCLDLCFLYLKFEPCHYKYLKESFGHGLRIMSYVSKLRHRLGFLFFLFSNWLIFNLYVSYSLSQQKTTGKHENQTSLKCLLNQKYIFTSQHIGLLWWPHG